MENRVNYRCTSFPCHDENKLQDCTFCYCPLYPCGEENKGKYLENGKWDCSQCTWIHERQRVDSIFQFLKNNMTR